MYLVSGPWGLDKNDEGVRFFKTFFKHFIDEIGDKIINIGPKLRLRDVQTE